MGVKLVDFEKYKDNEYIEYGLYINNEIKYDNLDKWNSIQIDITYEVCKDKKVLIVIDDTKFASVYDDYPSQQLANECFKGCVLNLNSIDKSLILDFISGTSIWDYSGILTMYVYGSDITKDYLLKLSSINDLINSEFLLKIFPTGDNLGLTVSARAENNFINNIIEKVIKQYS